MDWDDDPPTLSALPMVRPAPNWPLSVAMGLAVAAIVVAAVLRQFVPALITYGVLLIGGCGLLFFQRRLMLEASSKAGRKGDSSVKSLEMLAVAAVAAGCLANGVIIALEIASWDWGF